MISEVLLDELQRLDRGEKLRVIEILAGELSLEENKLFRAGMTYEIWSPFDAPEAANTLLEMLKEDQEGNE